jgi:hypothetical protein
VQRCKRTWLCTVGAVPADGARTIVAAGCIKCVVTGACAVVGARLAVHRTPVDKRLTHVVRVTGVRTIARGVAGRVNVARAVVHARVEQIAWVDCTYKLLLTTRTY